MLSPEDDERIPRALRYPDIELEANQFAGALLMPASHIDLRTDSPPALVERFAVSLPAAEVRLEYLRWVVPARHPVDDGRRALLDGVSGAAAYAASPNLAPGGGPPSCSAL